MKNVKWCLRYKFIEERYAAFKEKKRYLEENGLQKLYVLADLDKDYGDGLLKNLVICDGCNENIVEHEFPMIENELVYHLDCIKEELQKLGLPSNVIPFERKQSQ